MNFSNKRKFYSKVFLFNNFLSKILKKRYFDSKMNSLFIITFLLISCNILIILVIIYHHAQIKYHYKSTLPQIQSKILNLENDLFSNCSDEEQSDPETNQLLYRDYVKYVREYRINRKEFCTENPGLTSIIFVWSQVNGLKQREAIRQTWAQSLYRNQSSIKVLFVLGSTDNNEFQSSVEFENSKYEDILQFGFTDSYHNCTLKSIGVLRWTLFFCPNIKFLMKTDDDILVNTENLKNFIDKHRETKRTIFGYKAIKWFVFRNKDS